MSEDNNKSQTIIKDRRRFDESGNPREEAQVKETPTSDASVNFELKDSGKDPSSEIEINFSSFIVSLATQALMQMGQIAPPPGVDLPVDKIAAKQSIDLISMLQEKTKGNLDKTEAGLLEEVLHNLRISFLKM